MTEQALFVIGVIVAVEGLFKAIEYFISKITSQHDKVQQIDNNAESLEDYIEKNDARMGKIEEDVRNSHKYAFDALNQLEKTIKQIINDNNKEYMDSLMENKKEYVDGIKRVESCITETQAVYQQTTALTSVQIENLTKQVEKHNSVVERMFIAEGRLSVHDEQIRSANARLKRLDGQGRANEED